VSLHWVLGYEDIPGDELADHLAKEATKEGPGPIRQASHSLDLRSSKLAPWNGKLCLAAKEQNPTRQHIVESTRGSHGPRSNSPEALGKSLQVPYTN
jgi:hypothetical protein